MRQVNKILILFIAALLCVFLVFWELLQSRWVATQVSELVTDIVKKQLDAEVKFKKFDFRFYPPGAEISDVKLSFKRDEIEGDINFSKIGIYFNPIDFFHTKFYASEVLFEDGNLNIFRKEMGRNSQVSSTGFIGEGVDFEILKDIPVRKIKFLRSDIKYNQYTLVTNNLEIENLLDRVSIVGNFYSPDVNKLTIGEVEADSLDVSFVINASEILIDKLTVKSGLSTLHTQGRITAYLSSNINYDIDGDLEFPLRKIHEFAEFKNIGELNSGDARLKFSINGMKKAAQAKIRGEVSNVDTSFAYADKISFEANYTNNKLNISKFELLDGNKGYLKLLAPFELLNLDKMTFVNTPVKAKINKLDSENFLKFLDKDLGSLLRTTITGVAHFNLYSRDHYQFALDNKSSFNDLTLKGSNSNILKIKEGILNNSIFTIKKNKFFLQSNIETVNSSLNLSGEIGEGAISIVVKDGDVDMSEISPIVGLEFKGQGNINLKIVKKRGEPIGMEVASEILNFSLQGYSLDKLKSEMIFNFEKNTLDIDKIDAISGKTSIKANLDLNYSSLVTNGDFLMTKLNIKEAKKIFHPILSNFNLTQNEVNAELDFDGKISGKLVLDELIIKAQVKGKNLYLFEEIVDQYSSTFELSNNNIQVNEIRALKSRGEIRGGLDYQLPTSTLSYSFDIEDVPLSEISYYSKIPLNLRANLDGNIAGIKDKLKHNITTALKLTDTFVGAEKYNDSFINFKKISEDANVDISLFGGKISVDGNLIFSEKPTKRSNLILKLNVPDLKKIVSIASGTNLINSNFSGKLFYELESSFDLMERKIHKIESNVKILELKKFPVDVNYYNGKPEVIVNSGKVEVWDMNLRGKEFYILSQGTGDFNSLYDITTRLQMDASLLEIFNDIVTKANGSLRAKFHFFKDKLLQDYTAFLTSNDLSLVTSFIPTGISKTDMKLSLKSKKLTIEKFNAQLASGTLSLSGGVDISKVVPELDVRYIFKDAGISIFNKSNLVFSGEGSVVGKTFPYTVGGDFYIQKLVIINEISDFTKSRKSFLQKEIDYLPGDKFLAVNQLVNFNINVATRDPIYIANSIADVGFTGNIQLLGGEKDPRLAGKLSLASRTNKITFKNNEFIINKGNIFFFERNNFSNPDLDFLATSKISNYNLSVKVLGPVSEFDLGLSSDPALSQSDILSLIAFGYTEDVSQGLSDSEKESMTKAGVGSILFDSFKINETLKNEFGLQVNLGTEISEEQGSYLAQRNAEGAGSLGKVRSATTFEVRKQLSDKMSVTVSSTVGSNSSQKQSMNLNYTVNEKVSLEGVYESKTAEDTESVNNDTSVGADVKWKWSFK